MSFSLIRLGRPPTLWWLLIVAEGPLKETLSITSGIERALGEIVARRQVWRASSSKTLMKSRPMIFRFLSGSLTPFRAARNLSDAVDVPQVQVEPVLEEVEHFLRLRSS